MSMENETLKAIHQRRSVRSFKPDQITDKELLTEKNGAYTIELPTATAMQWQAQVKFLTDMTTNAVTKYDFSCKLVSTTDHPGA